MTLRDDVRAALDRGDIDAPDAPDALGDLVPELAGTALGHFADTASLADADALAPIVTAASPVPLDPLLDGVAAGSSSETPGGEDPDEFDRGNDELIDDEPVDADPGAFDEVDTIDAMPSLDADRTADADRSGLDVDAEEDAFGSGDATAAQMSETPDPFEEPRPVADLFRSEVDEFDPLDVGGHDEPVADAAPIDVTELDADPGDFDIID